jgi:hypothetical protein
MKEDCGEVRHYIAMPVTGSDVSDYFIRFDAFLAQQATRDTHRISEEPGSNG